MKRKISERTCIVCHIKQEKNKLLRIVKTKDGTIFYDSSGKAQGRGVYICRESSCLENFLTMNKFSNYFGVTMNDSILNTLRGVLNNE